MKTLIAILIFVVFLCPPAWAARTITLPHTEDFTESTSIDDLAWVTTGSGGSVTRTAESWRGGGNYCARIDPPTTAAAAGINGGYTALGQFLFSSTNILNVAFALNVGTTYSSTAANSGGSFINKFVDIFGATDRAGLLGINDRSTRDYHELGLANTNTDEYYYYGIPPCTGCNVEGVYFGDGTTGTRDYGGKWIFINYVVNYTSGVVTLRLWDRDGNYSSDYFHIDDASNMAITEIRTIGGYYNEIHPTADTNSRLLIDDLTISNSADAINPPDGFIGSSPSSSGVTLSGGISIR